MLDWLTFEFNCPHRAINSGKIVSFDNVGNEEWTTKKKIFMEGSFETKTVVKSLFRTKDDEEVNNAYGIYFDGNPSKFFQGHNVHGSDDIIKFAIMVYDEIARRFPHINNQFTRNQIAQGEFEVLRVDINHMFDLGTDNNVEQWLHAAELRMHGRAGRAQSSKGTVYYQKGSQLWSASFYNKYREVSKGGKKHRLHEKLEHIQEPIHDYLKGKLRAEIRLLAKQLKRKDIDKGYKLNGILDQLYNEFIGKIDMNANFELTDDKLSELPHGVLGTYHLWQSGRCVKEEIPKATFFRHKKILKQFNIDISVRPVEPQHSNVIPLIRVLEAKPVETPDWLKEYLV